jgi:hypothetical protein
MCIDSSNPQEGTTGAALKLGGHFKELVAVLKVEKIYE